MILSYRGFDTLGESCVLFLAVTAVMIPALRDRNNTSEMDAAKQTREDAIAAGHQDPILRQVSWLLVPFIFLFAIYVLLHGEESPGGGFSGGTVLGAGLILFSAAFGHWGIRAFMDRRTYAALSFGPPDCCCTPCPAQRVYLHQRQPDCPTTSPACFADRPGGGAVGSLHGIRILRPVLGEL